ncbi:metallophosphoesterase [Actinokineospora iranica]|uniref:Calcineurin-like phosphoesterase n=1 Tax=Actinokineospora iranica TaxID=1271860 RepID=A0A1G6TZP0_9PSEU|nr:metallophosphoesterase [Actinokineospora iranica]SDD34543.1 Calcineurin-like phosphoesterase [Actinokineospora iranica]
MRAPDLTLIQISDTHIQPAGELMHGRIDTLANLAVALDAIAGSGAAVHGLLLTGDLANDGEESAYRRLKTTLDKAAESLGCPVIYAMGNHDDRAAFRAVLVGEPGDGDTTAPYDAVHWLGGLRVVVLDSTAPGRHDGHLDDGQLAWLGAELAAPAPLGTVLVLHHPPLPSPVSTVHLLRLREPERLAEVLAGTDVRMILTGHAHHTGCGALAGIPVWVSPAVAYRVESLSPRERLRGVVGSGITRVDLIDGTFVATAVDLAESPAVYDEDEAAMVRYISDLTPSAG